MKTMLQKKGAVEFDKLVIIVIALAVLLIIIIFFRTGFGSVGGNIGLVTKNTTGNTGAVTKSITQAVSNATAAWIP